MFRRPSGGFDPIARLVREAVGRVLLVACPTLSNVKLAKRYENDFGISVKYTIVLHGLIPNVGMVNVGKFFP